MARRRIRAAPDRVNYQGVVLRVVIDGSAAIRRGVGRIHWGVAGEFSERGFNLKSQIFPTFRDKKEAHGMLRKF